MMHECNQCREAQEREYLAYIEEILSDPPSCLTPEQLAELKRFSGSAVGKSDKQT
jgi:hypothetical protein